MTSGHKHREIRLTPESWLYRVLRKPRYVTTDLDKVEASRFVYGPLPYPPSSRPRAPRPERWSLSLLGILHGLTGLTIRVPDKEE